VSGERHRSADVRHRRPRLSAHNEGFTDDYDLPTFSAYQETCASIAFVYLSHRLNRLTGEARYADMVEWALYNAVRAGVSLAGDRVLLREPPGQPRLAPPQGLVRVRLLPAERSPGWWRPSGGYAYAGGGGTGARPGGPGGGFFPSFFLGGKKKKNLFC